MKYTGSDPYIYANGVLRNRFNIQDQVELDIKEKAISYINTASLAESPIKGQFDLAHLQAIHKHLFQDIYPWAGEIRDGYLQKGGQDFIIGYRIVPEAKKLFQQLKQEKYLTITAAENMAARLAYYLGEINAMHPFREGSGRVQRIFIAQLAKNAGYDLHFNGITQEQMIEASKQAHRLNYSPLEQMIAERLSLLSVE
ncbi:Fic/DOC family protein [Testudinibacter sp. P80/BLE/0925]|uniref:Fic/DOC family protein n=1 Tax=Testudinibacter sp. TW-1 TaxID=3417757 RepID=UPI003D3676DE